MRDKRAKFVELANKRVTKCIRDLKLVGNLSNRSAYEFTDEDAKTAQEASTSYAEAYVFYKQQQALRYVNDLRAPLLALQTSLAAGWDDFLRSAPDIRPADQSVLYLFLMTIPLVVAFLGKSLVMWLVWATTPFICWVLVTLGLAIWDDLEKPQSYSDGDLQDLS